MDGMDDMDLMDGGIKLLICKVFLRKLCLCPIRLVMIEGIRREGLERCGPGNGKRGLLESLSVLDREGFNR
jgi:hypothetical protein